jgi:trafficking protein particle complex subunit 9
VTTLETPVGNEYLNSTLFPVVPTSSELPASLVNEYRNSIQANGSQSDLNGASVSRRGSLQLKRPASTGPGGVVSPTKDSFRQSTLMGNAPARKRLGIGAASSHGRLFKVLGDLFLLAGRTEDAVVW